MEYRQVAATSGTLSEVFRPAASFEGARAGYCFKVGDQGLGYYLDCTNEEISRRIRKGELSGQALFMLAQRGSFRQIEDFLAESPEAWSQTQQDGVTLLHWAAFKGDVAFLRQGLDAGHYSLEVFGISGQTPLFWAALGGHMACVHMLLSRGADLFAQDANGATALMLAASNGKRTPVCQCIAHAGPDASKLVRICDKQGRSAAHWAAFKGELDILKLLARFGADLCLLDASRCSLLHRATQETQGERARVLEFLIEQGVDPSIKNAEGLTCIDIAQRAEDLATHRTLIRVLARHGVDIGKAGANDFEMDIEDGGWDAVRKRKLLKQQDAEISMRKMIIDYWGMMAWIACVSFSVFEYLQEARHLGWQLAPVGSLSFELGVVLSLSLFFYVMKSDPGRVRTPPPDRAPNVEAVLQALRDGREIDVGRLCTTTWILKDLRTKYCTRTKVCVREFDHFCDFTSCAIGQLNHRQFYVLLLLEPLTQMCHLWVLACIALDSTAGIGWPSSVGEVFTWHFNAAWRWPLMAMVTVLHAFSLFFVLNLAYFQTHNMFQNITGNEKLNVLRYSHFWNTRTASNGRIREYVNPFCKGSFILNVADFWCARRRSEVGPNCPPKLCVVAQALKEAGAQ